MLRQQRPPVLARDNDGADKRLPRHGRKPAVRVDVEVCGELVVEIGPVGGLSAKAVEDQWYLNERWNIGHRLREDAMICGDRGGGRGGPKRVLPPLNIAPDDDSLDRP